MRILPIEFIPPCLRGYILLGVRSKDAVGNSKSVPIIRQINRQKLQRVIHMS